MPELTPLTVTQNNTEVSQQTISICDAHKKIYQASSWSIKEFDWAVTLGLTPPKNCTEAPKHAQFC